CIVCTNILPFIQLAGFILFALAAFRSGQLMVDCHWRQRLPPLDGRKADVPLASCIAMVQGVIFSLLAGIGLMALLFYSNRAGFDEPALFIKGLGDAPGRSRPKDVT